MTVSSGSIEPPYQATTWLLLFLFLSCLQKLLSSALLSELCSHSSFECIEAVSSMHHFYDLLLRPFVDGLLAGHSIIHGNMPDLFASVRSIRGFLLSDGFGHPFEQRSLRAQYRCVAHAALYRVSSDIVSFGTQNHTYVTNESPPSPRCSCPCVPLSIVRL